ncbi:MurR/RpiR family transcriptional regulator [Streptomyces sp. ST2-7A]|uniref:MurR/RpiR family transcriptional regulator n=1 Tax=Streptomyces sp. ST2-7A TaxID=2907214 RepID=UPI001F2900F8|nr:MurR/RpiR family transcriptional regulator [Streptomyces sp. ST2-7A]MCE7082888.1 MurR/RpiR family transcriptional regulator [Streptomyces sp. ST2-7A]
MDEASARLLKFFEGRRLTPVQRRIAHCLVRRAADAPYLSSVEVARAAGVSQPSVTRFAVALGYDGYPALRRALRDPDRQPGTGPGTGAGPARESGTGEGGTGADTVGDPSATGANPRQQAVLAELEHLRQLAALLADPRPVEEAAGLLAASRPLPVLGLRAAAAQAAGFAWFAAKVHPDVRPLTTGGSELIDRIEAAAVAGAGALLCFALPRYPREVGPALAAARTSGLRVVLVADTAFPPVAEPGDLVLPAAVGTALSFDTACAPMMLGRVLLEAMCDVLPGAEGRLERFETRAAERGLFVE